MQISAKARNCIEFQCRELEIDDGTTGAEFSELYEEFQYEQQKTLLATLHKGYIDRFKEMNSRLPTGERESHYWAENSRQLHRIIESTLNLYHALKTTELSFEIDPYYLGIINKCREFLVLSGGSPIPPHMDKIELYYSIPIFIPSNRLTIQTPQGHLSHSLQLLGEGSYAKVFKYKDDFYDRFVVLKRAKNELSEKELKRFRQEYDEMKAFSSPYIVEVFRYDDKTNEYVMEYMDYTLDKYIEKNNSQLKATQRKTIVRQIFKAFEYIHKKERLHRDISPKNILVKEYEDTVVVKIADFGLVKTPDSHLTSVNTEFKGYFNDPSLRVDGFDTYDTVHETYALTLIVYFVLTGRTNPDKIKDSGLRTFVHCGLNSDKAKRFQNVGSMLQEFNRLSIE